MRPKKRLNSRSSARCGTAISAFDSAPMVWKARRSPSSPAGPQTDQPSGVWTPGTASPTLVVVHEDPGCDRPWSVSRPDPGRSGSVTPARRADGP